VLEGILWILRSVARWQDLPEEFPAEVRLAETTLASIRVTRRHGPGRPRQKPERMIADGYDSVAPAAGAARDRVNRAASQEPNAAINPGWSSLPAV